ncbi:DUF4190 domain-containing protein [Rhabdothermincola salaria]|uniref:DUF4190 domain-containing protein n=1 Tax=Rhabdothermincola salaria TaxID=2903142 RepID=UPI001E560862|nr:DUF4190 domain-containing protein [Rhabdothermincola salaria]MCD9623935.1 DUF4190 domain-containing protein [Rhabdothermincola salaria]
MAVASLVFGILTFFCLGPIAGILAIVFGFVGLNRAKEIGVGKGMSIAGIVLGVIGSIGAVLIAVLFIFAADEAVDDLGGQADSDTYELTIDGSSCATDQFGFVTFEGTIANTSGSEKNFTIDVEFRDASDDVLIEDLADIVFDLAPGDTARWDVTTNIEEDVELVCDVTSVDNFFN